MIALPPNQQMREQGKARIFGLLRDLGTALSASCKVLGWLVLCMFCGATSKRECLHCAILVASSCFTFRAGNYV